MPARAPASMDMLQMVIRSSMLKRRMHVARVLHHVARGAGGADMRR